MPTSLPCFRSPGFRAAAARGVQILHLDLKGGFPINLIAPNTELRGGKRIGSSTVTGPGTFESCIPVTHMLMGGGGGSCGGVGMGYCNCLKKVGRALVLFPFSHFYNPSGEPDSTQI